jgi:hypothetical protein
MSRQPDEGIEVLRSVWSAQGQSSADLDEAVGAARSCKRMSDVGFGDLDSGGEDLRGAWRARLEREGKLNPAGGTIRDLIMGSPEARRAR